MSESPEFLHRLGAQDREQLEKAGRRRRNERGDVLLRKGDEADHVLVLLTGHVKVVVPSAGGPETVLSVRGPGALLGEQALVDAAPRSANVVAVEAIEVLVTAASAFRAYLATHPDVALAMLAVLSSKLRESDRRLAQFASADTLGRVSARLVELCDAEPGAGGGSVRIALPITQDELAGWAGASLESTAKALRTMRSLGWISTGRRAIEVHDLEALRGRAP